jgi:hypothetical protein
MSEKFSVHLDPCFIREDGTCRDYMVEEIDGVRVVMTNTIMVPPNKVKMTWYSYDGKELTENDSCRVPSYMWLAEIDGIPSALIRKVEYPPIEYVSNFDYMVKVHVEVLED